MTVAAVDIGSNTVRLLVADDGGERVRRVDVVGLGRGVDTTRSFSPEAMERALAVLADYGAEIARHGAERLRAVATSASRDAANSAGFLDRVAGVLGVRPEVISGEEEAALSYAGAIRALPGSGTALVIDPGGGSTEFVSAIGAVSVDIGSVRLGDRLLPDRPASPAQVIAAADHVRDLFAPLDLPRPDRVIGVAGTFTSLAAIALRLDRYDRDRVHGTVLTIDDLDELVVSLAVLSLSDTAAIPSLDPKRAPVMLPGAIIAAAAVRRTGLSEVIVSEADLLDAIAADLLPA